MCQGSDQQTLERLQGWQRGNYGFGQQYDRANAANFSRITVLPYNAHPMPGNMGYRYAVTIPTALPVVNPTGYAGDLPISQQPTIDQPQPWTYRYKG